MTIQQLREAGASALTLKLIPPIGLGRWTPPHSERDPLFARWEARPQSYSGEGWYAFRGKPTSFYVLFARVGRGRMIDLALGREAEAELSLSWSAFDFLCEGRMVPA